MNKKVDPTVKSLVEMFPEDFLRNKAKETGLIKRERKQDTPANQKCKSRKSESLHTLTLGQDLHRKRTPAAK